MPIDLRTPASATSLASSVTTRSPPLLISSPSISSVLSRSLVVYPSPTVSMNSMTAGVCVGCSMLDKVRSGAFRNIFVGARKKSLHSNSMCALDTNDSPQWHGSGPLSWSAPGSRSEGVRPAYSRQSARVVMQTTRLETSPKGDSSQIVSFTGSARGREPGSSGSSQSSSWWREIIF
jgi:hypothetical protein